MKWDSLFEANNSNLILLFGKRSAQLSKLMQNLIISVSGSVLVIDIHHRWSSQALTSKTHLIQPNNKIEVLESVLSLSLYENPRLKLIIIDNLPLFFRDFESPSKIHTRNQRSYAVSLALLRRLSNSTKIIVTSYTQGINTQEPFSPEISEFYCDDIIQVKTINNFTILTSQNFNWVKRMELF